MEKTEIIKIAVPLSTIFITLITFLYNTYFKVKVVDDFETLFYKKEDHAKFDFSKSIFNHTVLIVVFYIIPAFSFGYLNKEFPLQTIPLGIINTILVCVFILSIFLLLLTILYLAYVAVKIKRVREWKNKKVISTTIVINLITSLIFYCPLFIDVVYNGKFTNLLTFIIIFPIFQINLYINIISNINVKNKPKYIVEIVLQEQLEELNLIHDYIIDEKKTILYEKNISKNDIFYVCDFSSKVYLKYTRESFIHIFNNEKLSTKTTEN